jgi:hypothetical protein
MACAAPEDAPRRSTFARDLFGFGFLMAVILACLVLPGCAAQRPMSGAEMRAREECALLAAQAGGFDIWDAALRRAEVRMRCIRMKGFEP